MFLEGLWKKHEEPKKVTPRIRYSLDQGKSAYAPEPTTSKDTDHLTVQKTEDRRLSLSAEAHRYLATSGAGGRRRSRDSFAALALT